MIKFILLLPKIGYTFFHHNGDVWYYLKDLGLGTATKLQTVDTVEEADFLAKTLCRGDNVEMLKQLNYTFSICEINLHTLQLRQTKEVTHAPEK